MSATFNLSDLEKLESLHAKANPTTGMVSIYDRADYRLALEKAFPAMAKALREAWARAAALRAEVDMLRGVGCGEAPDGPCGACLKCARRERDEAREAFHEATRLRSVIQQARIKAEKERDKLQAVVDHDSRKDGPMFQAHLGEVRAEWAKAAAEKERDEARADADAKKVLLQAVARACRGAQPVSEEALSVLGNVLRERDEAREALEAMVLNCRYGCNRDSNCGTCAIALEALPNGWPAQSEDE